ncbi:MAG: hypothetical protein ACM3U2_13745 [Deltaproteobacteria bacterium]
MTRWLSKLGLPLLGKELIEQAARKRTYVVRVVYAALLFFAAYLFFYDTLRVNTAGSLSVLGRGREMFGTLVGLQFAGIYFFMPAMTCGVLTQEKERASLQLLFLTRLGPWTILFEKLFSRLVPMFGFLLLSLPLLAFAYTLGGISPAYLFAGVWMLVLATIQMGTLALACSAFFRTTSGAFISSYLLTAILFFGPGLLWLCLWFIFRVDINRLRNIVGPGWHPEVLVFPFFGPVTFFESMRPGMAAVWPIVFHSVLVLCASAVCLVAARKCVVRRAFLPPRNVMLNVFKVLDRIFLRLNDNPVTRGFVFIGDTAPLPGEEPVAWRETAKRSLGKARYLLRVFIALEVPVAILCTLLIVAESDARPLSPLVILLWIVSGLMVAAQSASLIAGERSHQTLEVLCTTPMSGREIVRQKFRAVRRLMLVLLVPFATIFIFESAMKWNMPAQWGWGAWSNGRQFSLPLYLACSALSVGIYLPLFAWLSFLIGLRARTQARAIVGAMAVLVAWCAIPPIFIRLPLSILTGGNAWNAPFILQLPMLASPMAIVVANEESFRFEFSGAPWVAVVLNFLGYGAILAVVRWACLRNVDRLLGRSENNLADVDFERLNRAPAAVPPQPAGASAES